MIININGEDREVVVQRKRMKNLVLRVDDDGLIRVSCPWYVTNEDIISFVKEKSTWILKTQRTQKRRHNEVLSGTDHIEAVWMGKHYKVRFEKANENFLLFEEDTIVYYLREINDANIENTFYREAGKYLLQMVKERRGDLDRDICEANGKPLPRITLKYMTSRWGSCTPAKSHISLSVRLIHFPPQCFDYVLIHEYAHILVPNHSKSFYEVVKRFMPDYKKYSDLLNH